MEAQPSPLLLKVWNEIIINIKKQQQHQSKERDKSNGYLTLEVPEPPFHHPHHNYPVSPTSIKTKVKSERQFKNVNFKGSNTPDISDIIVKIKSVQIDQMDTTTTTPIRRRDYWCIPKSSKRKSIPVQRYNGE